MKNRLLALIGFVFFCATTYAQIQKLNAAENMAKEENKLILLKFSGSDWCIPCIQLEKRVIEDSTFVRFAEKKLVIMIADFPRQKKHQLAASEQADNDQLASVYNPNGIFPYMVLLDEKGKQLFSWNGYDKGHTVSDYIVDIKSHLK